MHYVDSDFSGFGGELTTIRWSIVSNCFKRTTFDPLETDESQHRFRLFFSLFAFQQYFCAILLPTVTYFVFEFHTLRFCAQLDGDCARKRHRYSKNP